MQLESEQTTAVSKAGSAYNSITFQIISVRRFRLLLAKFKCNQNRTKVKTPRKINAKRLSKFEREFYHQLWKKRKSIKDLQIRNLLRTNIHLMKNLDVGSSVLF